MNLPEINKRDSANAECKKFKPLTDREAEVYCIGLERGFEQAKKLMLAKIKEEKEGGCSRDTCVSCDAFRDGLKWLEGELKGDSVSVETDTVEGVGLK